MAVFSRVPIAAVVIAISAVYVAAQQAPPSATPASADVLLAAAVKQAQAEKKNIFVDFYASWCGACDKLRAFLDAPVVRPIIEKHFVVLVLTVSERREKAALNNPGAEELMRKWSGDGGLPFTVILDPTGTPVPGGARFGFSGFRGSNSGGFVGFLADHSPAMSAAERAALLSYFAEDPRVTGVPRRILWSATGRFLIAAVSPDGRSALRPDGGDFLLLDLETGGERRLPTGGDRQDVVDPRSTVFSKDGRNVAFVVRNAKTGLNAVRSMDIARTRPVSQLIEIPAAAAGEVHVSDWSPDGQWLAVAIPTNTEWRIALLSATDSALRVLRSTTTRSTPILRFSPDGRWLAVGAAGISVMALDSGHELPVVTDVSANQLVGWSTDGRVLFTSDRTGSWGLWGVSFDGGTIGAPRLLAPALSAMTRRSHTVTAEGVVVYSTEHMGASVTRLAAMEFASGEPRSFATDAVPDFIGETNVPAFSRDGKSLAYIADRYGIGGRKVLAIANLETGQTRELRPTVPEFGRIWVGDQRLHWSPDGRMLALISLASEGGATIHLIGVDGGAVRSIGAANSDLRLWSMDNRLYFDRAIGSTDLAVIEHDVTTGHEREIFRGPAGDVVERRRWPGGIAIAPDGQTIYFRRVVDVTNQRSEIVARDLRRGAERVLMADRHLGRIVVSPTGDHLVAYRYLKAYDDAFVLTVVPTAGGPIRELQPQSLYFRGWAADGRSLIGDDQSRKGEHSHWWVPIDGRPGRRLEMLGGFPLEMNISPDGRRFAYKQSGFFSQAPLTEVWALEVPMSARASETIASPPVAQAPRERVPVAWSIAVPPGERVVPGGSFNAIVTAKIDPGWWVYAMSQPPGGPIAMTVDVPKTQRFALAGAVVEPKPTRKIDRTFDNLETLYFEGTPAFTVPMRVNAGTAAGRHELTVNVEYQACSADLCLQPTTIALKINVAVATR